MKDTRDIDYTIVKDIQDVKFKWFDYTGKEVPYGEHVPWMFEVSGEGIKTEEVVKVQLPICDYGHSSINSYVILYCRYSK